MITSFVGVTKCYLHSADHSSYSGVLTGIEEEETDPKSDLGASGQ